MDANMQLAIEGPGPAARDLAHEAERSNVTVVIPPSSRVTVDRPSRHCRTCTKFTRSGGGCPGRPVKDETVLPLCHAALHQARIEMLIKAVTVSTYCVNCTYFEQRRPGGCFGVATLTADELTYITARVQTCFDAKTRCPGKDGLGCYVKRHSLKDCATVGAG